MGGGKGVGGSFGGMGCWVVGIDFGGSYGLGGFCVGVGEGRGRRDCEGEEEGNGRGYWEGGDEGKCFLLFMGKERGMPRKGECGTYIRSLI